MFEGGPRAWYCPECREERKKQHNKKCKERRKAGKIVPVGSTIQCEMCGKDIIKNGGLQRFCADCAKKHLKMVDNQQSRQWAKQNRDKVRDAKRRYYKQRYATDQKESGVKGVYWDRGKRKWIAHIYHKGKRYVLLQIEDLSKATEIRHEAEEAVKNGLFDEWFIKIKD